MPIPNFIRRLFGRIRREAAEPECLRFLRSLAASESPTVRFEQHAGYRYIATLNYNLIRIELEYNSIRRQWNLDVRDKATCNVLYGYYVTWWSPPRAPVDFLLDTYALHERFDQAIETNQAKDKKDKQATVELRTKYLKP